jgi:hypothetical protein
MLARATLAPYSPIPLACSHIAVFSETVDPVRLISNLASTSISLTIKEGVES